MNLSSVWTSPQCTREVELDPQQVPHAGLSRVVNHKLIVEEGVTVALSRPGGHPRAHGHRDPVPKEKTGTVSRAVGTEDG